MVPITVVISMTGLLLLTPSTNDHRLPMHVLMPVPRSGHLAQIGYRQAFRQGCDDYDRDLSICYRNMEGYWMEIGPQITLPTSQAIHLGEDFGDVSDAAQQSVDPKNFGNNPGGNLRARITLRAGTPKQSCHLGRWLFHKNPFAPLANVVNWEIPNAAVDSLVLTRRRFRSDLSKDPETLVVLHPIGNVIELFIRQIPPTDTALDYFATANSLTHDAMRGTPQSSAFKSGASASHFDAFYDLLGVAPGGKRPRPRLVLQVGSNCLWARSLNLRITAQLNPLAPGTASCMVATGTPP